MHQGKKITLPRISARSAGTRMSTRSVWLLRTLTDCTHQRTLTSWGARTPTGAVRAIVTQIRQGRSWEMGPGEGPRPSGLQGPETPLREQRFTGSFMPLEWKECHITLVISLLLEGLTILTPNREDIFECSKERCILFSVNGNVPLCVPRPPCGQTGAVCPPLWGCYSCADVLLST